MILLTEASCFRAGCLKGLVIAPLLWKARWLRTATGDKYQFPDPGHCKYTARTWTMYLGKTHLVHHKYIQNVPKQFPCSVPSAGNAQDIYSVPGHVIAMS